MPIERAIARTIMSRLVGSGLSQNQVFNLIRQAGAGYRTSSMIADFRQITGRFVNQFYIEKLGANEVVSQDIMVETDLGIDRNYRVYGKMTYYDEFQDEYYEETKSFYTNNMATKEDMENEFLGHYYEQYYVEGMTPMTFQITAVEHNSGYNY
jgi:hypothetical protein